MAYLFLHCHRKEYDEIKYQYWPEYGYVEEIKAGTYQTYDNGLGCAVPEFKFWELPHEGPKFFTGLRWQR